MQSILEVLQKSEAYLDKAGLETPKLDAQLLMADALGCKRLDLFLQHDHPMKDSILQVMRESLKRRASREPLQYILGYSDFHDIRLNVSPGVLIPRPETESLVEEVIDRLKSLEKPRIVDLGTGSGAIALALGKALPGARILAVDSSAEALVVARENAETLGLREQVAFRSGNWLENLDFEADCIVSNPPYLTEEEWASALPEVRDHEPKQALVAGDAGTADLKVIIDAAIERLAPNGLLALEMGIAHGPSMRDAAEKASYSNVEVMQDHSQRDRFLFAEKK